MYIYEQLTEQEQIHACNSAESKWKHIFPNLTKV